MAKALVYDIQVRLVQPRSTTLKRAIELKLDGFEAFSSFLVGDVPDHPSYLPTAYRKLSELLDETQGAWCEPGRRLPEGGTVGLLVPCALTYQERDHSIHVKAPSAPKFKLRLVDRHDGTTQSELYRVLFHLLEVHDRIPASVYA